MSDVWNFNVLTDPWVPLRGPAGVERASVVEVLTGARDADALGHPREDFDLLARVLLSGIAQALFPADSAAMLRERIARPMTADAVMPVVERVLEGFNLLGERPFLQPAGGTREGNDTASLLLDVSGTSRPKLLRHDRSYDALCPPCMTVALFGCQFFAGAGGAGYRSGLRGPTSLLTLVWLPTLRASLWANTIIEPGGPRASSEPWRGAAIDWSTEAQWKGKRSRADVSLAEGIFFQPRAVTCRPFEEGSCGACGSTGPRIAAFRYGKGQGAELSNEGVYIDPWLPTRLDGEAQRSQSTPADKPVWTGLADMLSVTRGGAETRNAEGDAQFAAPVVQQWFGVLRHSDVRLAVFGQLMDKANLLGRLSAPLSLAMRKPEREGELLAAIRGCVQQAERVAKLLVSTLERAWYEARPSADGRERAHGSYWPADALANFWRKTEAPFFDEVRRLEGYYGDDDAPDQPSGWADAVRKVAIAIYDESTAEAAVEPRRQRLVARQRRALVGQLYALFNPRPARAEKAIS